MAKKAATKAKVATPNPGDVLRLGTQTATIKASMKPKRWASFVKLAHARGHTIAGELSNDPASLKERTTSSMKAEAAKSVATAYAPATKALGTREKAIGYLNDKRKSDAEEFRTWLTGETDKLNAQASAADATLATQQGTIATETATAIAAARADSLKRMAANAGGVSDPNQSVALDTSAADTLATQHVQAARDQTAAISKIGGDSREMASSSVLGMLSAQEAARAGETFKALADVSTERNKLLGEQAGATLDKTTELTNANATRQQANRDSALASASLGVKQDDLAAQIAKANQDYKIKSKQFTLTQWKAKNAAEVDKAKLQLGYDSLKAKHGEKVADRKLNEKLTKLRETNKIKAAADKAAGVKKKTAGVTQDEKDRYAKIQEAARLFKRWDKNNAVPLAEREQHAISLGLDPAAVTLGHEIARSGKLSTAGKVAARRYGVTHVGYFWPPQAGEKGSNLAGPPAP